MIVHNHKQLAKTVKRKMDFLGKSGLCEGEASVAFVNGCFDTLHVGHLGLIHEARLAAGNNGLVVVALDSDQLVAASKGAGRPVVALSQRMQMVDALRDVDLVTWFDTQEELSDLIRSIGVDFLVKGDDWAGREVVGADHVEARNGLVLFVPRAPGVSSSEIIRRACLAEEIKGASE